MSEAGIDTEKIESKLEEVLRRLDRIEELLMLEEALPEQDEIDEIIDYLKKKREGSLELIPVSKRK